jgi:flagellar hook-associated protein 3 FlgL
MANSISDVGTQISRSFLLRILREDVSTLDRQIATGKKSTDVGGMGTMGASNAVGFRNRIALNNAYTKNLEASQVQFEVMDKAMLSIADMARDTLMSLRKQLQDTVPKAEILSQEAESKMNSVIDKLNAQVNGRYVFAGDNIYDAPHNDLAGLNASISAQVAGWLAGTPTPASVVTDARTESGTALGFDANLLTAGNVSFRADTAIEVEYDVLANQAGFSDILRGLAIVSNLSQPTTPAEQINYWEVINGAITLLDEGTKAIDDYQGILGVEAKMVDTLMVSHRENTVVYEDFVGGIEDVDMADASIRLQALQVQLEASYGIVAQLKGLSLVNYL